MMLTRSQQVFVFLCRNVLFISFFKRYWPVGGSYWNSQHINKNNPDDLRQVIKDATNYTRQHVQQTFGLLFVFLAMLYAQDMPAHTKWCFVAALIMEMYAFIAHHYNRILAREQLSKLGKKENLEEDSQKEDYQSVLFVSITRASLKGSKEPASTFYSVVYRPTYQSLSPLLCTRQEAECYLEYLTHAWLKHSTSFQLAKFSRMLFLNQKIASEWYERYLTLLHEKESR